MATLTMRTYAGEADLQPIADLLNACEAVDRLDEGISVEELRVEFGEPSFDPARDLQLWEDDDGQMIGYGQLSVPDLNDAIDGYLWFRVHPDARGGDIEAQIIAWGAERMREVGRERGASVSLVASARDQDAARKDLLERHGFAIIRYFWRMARPLDQPIPAPRLPDGFTIVAGNQDPEAWAAMFNDSFIDHWRNHPFTAERYVYYTSEGNYRPELNLAAVAPDGALAGFCWCDIPVEENARSGQNDGWVGVLGTRRGFRKIGLGRALLLEGMRRLKDAGVATAKLGVDADSPTGATRLYESVGFSTLFSSTVYEQTL